MRHETRSAKDCDRPNLDLSTEISSCFSLADVYLKDTYFMEDAYCPKAPQYQHGKYPKFLTPAACV